MVNEKQKPTKEDLLEQLKRAIWLDEQLQQQTKDVLNDVSQRMQFIEGIGLGLLYGIIGNIVVSHYYGLYERHVLGVYDSLFWSNLYAFLLGFAIVVVVTIFFIRRLARLRKAESRSKNLMTKVQDARNELMALEDKLSEGK